MIMKNILKTSTSAFIEGAGWLWTYNKITKKKLTEKKISVLKAVQQYQQYSTNCGDVLNGVLLMNAVLNAVALCYVT